MTATTSRPPEPPASGRPATTATSGPTATSGTTATAAAPPTDSGAMRPREPDHSAPATAALALLTLVTAAGLFRLFRDASFLAPVLASGAVASMVSWALRRRGASLLTALPLALGASALVTAWLVVPDSTAFGIPTADTLHTVSAALAAAGRDFRTVVAPAPATDGFVIASAYGVALTAVLADWAAFRNGSLLEAVAPSFTLFLFTAILATPQHRTLAVTTWLAAVLLFLLVHQAAMASASASWFASRSRGGAVALLQGGALLGGAAILAAVVLGPLLPGSNTPALLDYRHHDAPASNRTTVSPLVDIRGRLTDRSTAEVFTVKSSAPALWRLTSLDTFDGQIWQSNDSYKKIGERLTADAPIRARTEQVTQEFTITGLSSIWLPTAYRPVRIEGVDDTSFNTASGSLITGKETSDGLTYKVTSALVRPTVGELQVATDPPPGPQYVRLPAIPARVTALANQIVAGQTTAFGRAKAIQDFFQKSFTYDLTVPKGHDDRVLESFLFRTRRGYCEQFAGAFGVLARAVGLPTRVAVGFTQGELQSDGLFHVQGLHAHAWPEVYLDGVGWTYFEPTPGRGAPGTSGYTGVREGQAAAQPVAPATTAPTPTTVAGDNPTKAPVPTTLPKQTDLRARHRRGVGSLPPVAKALLVLVALAVVGAAAVPLAKLRRRRARRARNPLPGQRVLVHWAEAEEALATAGVHRHPAETLDEFARRAPGPAHLPPETVRALVGLARDTATVSYAPGSVAAEVGVRAAEAAAEVERALVLQRSGWEQLLQTFDPRPLVRHRARASVGDGTSRRAA